MGEGVPFRVSAINREHAPTEGEAVGPGSRPYRWPRLNILLLEVGTILALGECVLCAIKGVRRRAVPPLPRATCAG